ncbi:hypothetical protein AAC387_Pa03g4351 [Persea americana]|uniref:Nonexpressor of pathogenesis-related protein 1-like 2 protein n=1 Tax=Persea americana var. drymifolia TaxID=580376 RepID=A0A0F7LGW4_PERAE|nr:nonexpressor of pathogenesis-related protein 1-like 2 protein [Persea americana var. drymifolia]
MEAPAALSDSNDYSSCVSNGDTLSNDSFKPPNVVALNRLSENLGSLFLSPDFDFCADARILVPPSSSGTASREIPVHRCILSARSPFFRSIFSTAAEANPAKEKGWKIELKELAKDFDLGYDSLVSVLTYLYSGKARPLPDGVCICVDEKCSHVACRPAVDFMVEVLYGAFTFQITEMVTLYQRHLLDIIDKVAVDDILVILSVASMCDGACERLLNKCIETVASALAKSDIDTVTLEKTLTQDVVKKIIDCCSSLGVPRESIAFPDKHVKRILRALDSDDVELVRMLLKEGHTSLDDAYALHYAVAYCDSKITTELLDIGLADVNHKNTRGHSVLHVAAMRKEPKIIVSLLTKGARPFDLTPDGRKALQICKRLTKSLDYKPTKECMATPKDRLCIEILEQAERSEPLLGEASESLAAAGDDLRSRLLYLESRVSLAKILFPMEAKVAMDIAQVERTSPLPLVANSKLTPGNQSMPMDLNDAPFKLKEEHLARLKALSRTVELGKRFFPRCSAVLNNIVDDDELSELANLETGSWHDRETKKQRFNEIQNIFTKAFIEDKQENDRSTASAISSSSSSTSIRAQSRLMRK